MKLKIGFPGFLLLVILQMCLLNEKVYPATIPLQKTNLGVYGARDMDITAYNNSGTTEILVAIESPKGIYKWTSGSSSSWDAVTYPAIPGEAYQIEVNLASGYENDVYAIINDGMYGSDSGGVSGSWVSIPSVSLPPDAPGVIPGILLGHSSGMYVATFDGNIYRNTGGVNDTFNLLYSFGTSTEITSISVFDADNIFVVTKSGGAATVYKLVISSGPSVTALTLPSVTASGTGLVDINLVGVDPTDMNTIFLAGSSANPQVYKSIDGGTTWSSSWDYASTGTSNFPSGYPPHYIKFNNNRVFISASVLDGASTTWSHAPILSSTVGSNTIETHPNEVTLEIDPIDPTIIYIGTDWGFGQMTYASGSWTAGSEIGNNNGLEGVMIFDMDFYEYSSTHKELWVTTESGAGRAINYDPTDPTTTDDPSDWNFPIFPQDEPADRGVAIHPADPTIVLVGNSAGRVYKTTTGTSTSPIWTKVFQAEDYPSVFGSTRPDHSRITSIKFVPSTPNRMYLSGYNWETGTDGGVYYSDDTGDTWTEDTSISGIPVNTLWVTDSTCWSGVGNESSSETGLRARTSITGAGNWWSPTTGLSLDNEIVTCIAGTTIGGATGTTTVYVTTTGGVYKGTLYLPTSTGFSSWNWTSLTSAIGATSFYFTSVTLDPNNPDTAYVAMGNCIYETTDGGVTWSVFGSSCVNTHERVMVLKFDDLVVGTAMGLFSYLPTTTATPTPTVTPTLSPLPTPSPTPATVGKISGSVVDIQGTAVESVKLTLKGVKTKYSSATLSGTDGSFEFTDLKADTYVITAKKKGYKKARQKVKLGEGEEKTGVKIELRKLKKIHFHKAR